jgi:hypothetical protein
MHHVRGAHRLLVSIAVVLLWLASAPQLHAQTLYEWREPGGALAYSQLPPRPQDGVLLRRIELPALEPQGRRAAARVMAQGSPSQSAEAASLRRADTAVSQALARLQAAERALRAGQAPQPGERRHLVNGHSRLTKTYFDRIAVLKATVTRARESLQSAYAARDALASGAPPR